MKRHTLVTYIAATIVAVIAAAASFEHIASVAIDAGERVWVALAIPIALDGLVMVGFLSYIDDRRQGRRWRFWGQAAVILGVGGTLLANWASAEDTVTAKLVAIAAPLSFMVSVKVLTTTGRPKPQASLKSDQAQQLDAASEDAVNRAITAAMLARENPTMAPKALATEARVSIRHARRVLEAYRPSANGAHAQEVETVE